MIAPANITNCIAEIRRAPNTGAAVFAAPEHEDGECEGAGCAGQR